jgi:phage terminase large subunit-like protein
MLWKKTFYWHAHSTLATWFPTPEIRAKYPKQMAHFKDGAFYDERGLFGGNRCGKTHCSAYEIALHLTGLYPEWWEGRRYEHPVDAWMAGDTAKNTRDILQEKFCGKPGIPELLGTGMIPVDSFVREPTTKHGVADAYESCFVHHYTNGIADGTSTLQFKSYDQGRQAFQGTAQDLIGLDEEPKLEIYTECALRLMSTAPGQKNGSLILTETPLLGVTELMLQFMPDLAPAAGNPLQDFDVGEDIEVDE